MQFIFWKYSEKVICCHEKSPQKCSFSLAVSPSARYDLIPFIPLEPSPWLSARDDFFAVPAGESLLVPFGLSSCAAVPVCLSSALPHQVPYFLHSLLPQQLSITFPVSTEYLPDIYVFPVLCNLWRCCQPGCESAVGVEEADPSGASSSARVPASEGLDSIPARGLSCGEAVCCSSFPDPSFYLAASAPSSKQCQVSKHFCLCLGLKILSLLPAGVQQPTNL